MNRALRGLASRGIDSRLRPVPHLGTLIVEPGAAMLDGSVFARLTVLAEDGRRLASIGSVMGVWVALIWADQVLASDMLDRGVAPFAVVPQAQ